MRDRRASRGLRILAVGLGVVVFALLLYWITLPSAEPLVSANPSTTAYIDAYRQRTGQEPRWSWVSASAISTELKVAIVAGEDMGFFSHVGFDSHEIRESIRQAWEQKKPPRGASTITQQLARNLWLAPNRSYLRKLREFHLSKRLEATLTKRRILEIYLNVVEFGPGVYGVEAASRHYYGVSAGSIDRDQAAALAALLPQPSLADVRSTDKRFQARRKAIAGRTDKAKWLSGLV